MRKINCFRSSATTCAAKLQLIIDDLFLRSAEFTYSMRNLQSPDEIPEVSSQELKSVCREMILIKHRRSMGSQTFRIKRPLRVILSCFDKFLMFVFRKGCSLGYEKGRDWFSFWKVTTRRMHWDTAHSLWLIRPENFWKANLVSGKHVRQEMP